MKNRLRIFVAYFVAYVATSFAMVAQAYEPPRLDNGRPDFNGVWQVMNRANDNLEAHAGSAAYALQPGPVVPVPAKKVLAMGAVGAVPAGLGVVVDNEIPYTKDALVQRNKNRANWLEGDPEVKCYLPGVPRANYMNFGFEIVHNSDALVFSYEYAGGVRDIHQTNPGLAPLDSWMGQSWLSWDGDTMVIETSGFNGQTWLDRSGNFHSDQLKVTERYTRTSDYTLSYEARLEDPTVFTRPWIIKMPIYKRVPPDDRLMQFNCVEYVEELLYGHLRKEPIN